jgi:alpha-L-fucosidase 2
MAEVLLQSHAGELHLLPGVYLALWPNGSFRGLKARGGFEVAGRWRDGKLVEADILAARAGNVELRSEPIAVRVVDDRGSTVRTVETPAGTLSFGTRAGGRYRVEL